MMIIFCVFLGIIFGTMAGFLPGITTTTVIILLYPFLKTLPVTEVLVFFITVVSTLQYYGSISAIVFGVMGETTSAPAVFNGNKLFRLGYGDIALTATATSSLIGSFFGVVVFWIISVNIDILIVFLTAKVKIVVLCCILAMTLIWCKSKILGVVCMLVGLSAGVAGSVALPWNKFIITNLTLIDGGIPLFPLMLGLIIVPLMLENIRKQTELHTCSINKTSIKDRFRYLLMIEHFPATVRGSLIGCIAGAIPGVSYAISSNLAESVEKLLNKNDTSVDSMKRNLYAAEAANNAGTIVVIAPFMLFALPIVSSEAVILGILESNGVVLSDLITLIHSYMLHIVIGLIVVNSLNWVISGVLYKSIIALYQYLEKYVYLVVMIASIALALYLGIIEYQFKLSVVTLVLSTIIGICIKCDNTKMMFLFSFFIASELVPEMYRQMQIYFG